MPCPINNRGLFLNPVFKIVSDNKNLLFDWTKLLMQIDWDFKPHDHRARLLDEIST